MSNMYSIIEELCVQKGVNITQMCREASVPRATLTELKKGRTVKLSTMNLAKLSTYFDVPIDFFLDEEQKKLTSTEGREHDYDEVKIMDLIKKADKKTRDVILLILEHK